MRTHVYTHAHVRVTTRVCVVFSTVLVVWGCMGVSDQVWCEQPGGRVSPICRELAACPPSVHGEPVPSQLTVSSNLLAGKEEKIKRCLKTMGAAGPTPCGPPAPLRPALSPLQRGAVR